MGLLVHHEPVMFNETVLKKGVCSPYLLRALLCRHGRLWRLVVQLDIRDPVIVRVWHVIEMEQSVLVPTKHTTGKLLVQRVLLVKHNVGRCAIRIWGEKIDAQDMTLACSTSKN